MSIAPLNLVGRKTFSVTRPGIGSYVNGMYQEAASTVFSIIGNIQPPTASELTWFEKQNPPEAGQSREIFLLYTLTELMTLDEATDQKPDIVSYKNKQYEVQRVWPYEMGVLDHFKVLLVRYPDQ